MTQSEILTPKDLYSNVKGSEEDRKLVEKLLTSQISISDALKAAEVRHYDVKSTLARSQAELCQEHRDAEARVSRCGRVGRPSLKYAARQDSGLACTCGAVLGYFEDRYPSHLSDP